MRARSALLPVCALAALLAGVVVSSAAAAAPIVVEYTITGGQAYGTDRSGQPHLGHASIVSGTVVVTMPCGGSAQCATLPASTGDPRVGWTLYFTNGATSRGSLAGGYFGQAVRGPSRALELTAVEANRLFPVFYSTAVFRLRANAQGAITSGRYDLDVISRAYTPSGALYYNITNLGFTGLVGQEVASAPEPRPAALLPGALLSLVAFLGLGRLLRRQRAPI